MLNPGDVVTIPVEVEAIDRDRKIITVLAFLCGRKGEYTRFDVHERQICETNPRQKVIDAALAFCKRTADEMAGLEGSISLDIPVEFTELQHAVRDLQEQAGA